MISRPQRKQNGGPKNDASGSFSEPTGKAAMIAAGDADTRIEMSS